MERVDAVFAELLRHTKGRWARRPFHLTDWQRDDIVAPLFGDVEWDPSAGRWVRTHRVAWIELARKNGKSELLAGVALVLLVADDEEGAEVYGAAVDRDQASIVWQVAERMVQLSPTLSRRLRIYRQTKRIVDDRTGSYYQVLPGDALGNLGLNPHGVVFDEVHAQKSPALWDALRTSMGTRDQPLMIAATTAGNDPSSFAANEHAYSEQVALDPKLDRRRFVYMRNMPVEADPFDEANWAYPNPALGDFLSVAALRDEAHEARLLPSKENAWRQFRCNQWVRSVERWLSIDAWDATSGSVDETALAGRRCYGGLDLANTADLTALCWAFPTDDGDVALLWRHFYPEDRIGDLDKRTGGNASAWARQGFLTLTPGNVLDHAYVLRQVDADARRFDVADLAFDRWGMSQMRTDLAEAGLPIVDMGQGFASMSAPAKEFERLVLAGQLRHGGNPLVRWQAGHVVVVQDAAGNVKPDKAKSHEKVDGIVAAIMALDRLTRALPVRRSAYEDGGLSLL